eukprot:359269_1
MSLTKLLSESAKKRRQNLSSIRFNIQQKLFARFNNLRTISPTCSGTQIPKLWCPTICHYKQQPSSSVPEIDTERNCIHLGYLSQYIGGYLINGSTGDGWALNSQQQETILKSTLDFMHSDNNNNMTPILLGALAHDYNSKILSIKKYSDILEQYYESEKYDYIYKQSPFVGFAINPPSNTNNQKEMEECLADIIDNYKHFPFVLYQLPQITNSEMSIETVNNLVSRFGNIIMLKDSSGTDNILKSQKCLDGVFMVRGAEGNQMESLMNMNYGVAGYNGLLLSTANNYAKELNQMMNDLMNGNWMNAQQLSKLVTDISKQTFDVVGKYNFCNPFTNSAKMVDYFIAYGEKVSGDKGSVVPMTQDGITYDIKDLMTIKDILVSNGILENSNGYMNDVKQWWKKH